MENSENNLHHDEVHKENFFSEIHYFNEVEFYLKFDELLDEYSFLLDIEDYVGDIPTDTVERYEVFKKSIAQFHYMYLLQEYKDLTMRSDIESIVTALYQECIQMIKNPQLEKTHPDYCALYLRATRFIRNLATKGKTGLLEIKKHSKNDIETMLYLLHREGYFKIFPIPEETFDVNTVSIQFIVIAEVYAKYELFYKFIRDIYDDIQKKKGEPLVETVPERKNNAIREMEEKRTVVDLINDGYLDKYKNLIETLSDAHPLIKIINRPAYKSDAFKKREVLANQSFQKQMIYKNEENKIIVDDNYYKLDTLFRHLFSYLIVEGWMKKAENISVTARIINNTFYCKSDESLPIDIDIPQFTSVLNKMIEGKVPEDNPYLKFIKMLIA